MLSISVFPLSAIMIINITLLQAIGKAKSAGFLVAARQLVLYVPVVLLLPVFLGVRGVWLAAPIVDGTVAIISIFFIVQVFRRELQTA